MPNYNKGYTENISDIYKGLDGSYREVSDAEAVIRDIPQNFRDGLRESAFNLGDFGASAIGASKFFHNKDGLGKKIRDGGGAFLGGLASSSLFDKAVDGIEGHETAKNIGRGVSAIAGGDLTVRGMQKMLDNDEEKTAGALQQTGIDSSYGPEDYNVGENVFHKIDTEGIGDAFIGKMLDNARYAIHGNTMYNQIVEDENPYRGALKGLFDGTIAFGSGNLGKNLVSKSSDSAGYQALGALGGTILGNEASKRYVRPKIEEAAKENIQPRIKQLYNESKEASSLGRKAGVGAGSLAAAHNVYDFAKNIDINDPKKTVERTGKNLAGTAAGAIAGGVLGRNISGGSQSATKAGVGIGSLIGSTQTSKLQDKLKKEKPKPDRSSFKPQ